METIVALSSCIKKKEEKIPGDVEITLTRVTNTQQAAWQGSGVKKLGILTEGQKCC